MRRKPPVVTLKAPIGSSSKVSKPADTDQVAGLEGGHLVDRLAEGGAR